MDTNRIPYPRSSPAKVHANAPRIARSATARDTYFDSCATVFEEDHQARPGESRLTRSLLMVGRLSAR